MKLSTKDTLPVEYNIKTTTVAALEAQIQQDYPGARLVLSSAGHHIDASLLVSVCIVQGQFWLRAKGAGGVRGGASSSHSASSSATTTANAVDAGAGIVGTGGVAAQSVMQAFMHIDPLTGQLRSDPLE